MAGLEEKLDSVIAQQANMQEQLVLLNDTLLTLPHNLAEAFSKGKEKKQEENNNEIHNEEVGNVENIPCQG